MRPEAVSIQTYLKNHQRAQTSTTSPGTAGFPPRSINALYSLLENRYQRQYPLPQYLRYPQSQPAHYDDLMEEFRDAPSRNWWGRVVKRMKGMLRLQ